MTTTTHTAFTTTAEWIALASEIGAIAAPMVSDTDRTGEISFPAFDRIRELGLSSALVPTEFGGGGVSHATMGAILREMGRHDPSTSLSLSMHSHLVATQVWRHKHGLDATGVFAKVVSGALLISTGASDWIGSNGSAAKVEGGYVVSARKAPASGAEVGQILVTSIRWDESPDGPQVLHCSIPMSAEGVSIDKTWDTLGMRASGSHTVVLDDVFVPDAAVALVRPADVWHPIWNAVLGSAMPLIMSVYAGVADAASEISLDLVSGRSEPHVIQLAGEMINARTMAGDALDAMFRESDDLNFPNDDRISASTLARKTIVTDALIETVRLAIELSGGRGYLRSSALERLYRDIHGSLFHPLPRAKQLQLTGRSVLGLELA